MHKIVETYHRTSLLINRASHYLVRVLTFSSLINDVTAEQNFEGETNYLQT